MDNLDKIYRIGNDILGQTPRAYERVNQFEKALPLLEEMLKLRKAKLGPEHPDTLESLNDLAEAYSDAGKLDLAIPLFEEALKLWKAKLGTDHPDTLVTMNNLAVALVGAGRPTEATALAKESLALSRASLPADSPQLAQSLAVAGLVLLRSKAFTEVEPILRECLAIREKHFPESWLIYNTQSLLGGALSGQKKYAEAEPLLLKGYEGMKQRADTIPPQGKVRLTEAVERLVQLYEALEKKEEAAKWRMELEAMKPSAKP